MARGDLTSTEWAIIGPLLPPERGRLARPALDNRRFEIVDRAVLSLKDADTRRSSASTVASGADWGENDRKILTSRIAR